MTTLDVRLHTLPLCASGLEASSATLTLLALGDFEATNESAEILALDTVGADLRFPSETLAVEARVSGQPGFWGYGERRREGLDALLWPRRETCLVSQAGGAQGYPGRTGGQGLGWSRQHGRALAAGGNDALVSDAIIGALMFDAATGRVTTFDTSDDSTLQQARAFATVTELGDELLVAGGENPVFGVPARGLEPRDTAEVFEPRLARFTGESIRLSTSRTRHAAVTLPSGDTLLIGGRTGSGDSSTAQRLTDLISAETRRASPRATLAVGRLEPRATLLDDGRVFVGGGTIDGHVVEPSCEWISSDLSEVQAMNCVPPSFDRAFLSFSGGGVLAVGGCEERAPQSDAEADACALCANGCPPWGGYDAYWVDSAGNATPVLLPPGIAAAQPILLPGSDGRPWLVATNQAGAPRLLRFDPWAARFEVVELEERTRLPRPGFPPPIAIAPDSFVWLDDEGQRGALLGLRLGTRNRFTQDVSLVLQSDPTNARRPLHLVPNRPLRDGENYDGKLWLTPAPDGGVVVSVADTDYADVTIAVQLAGANRALGIPEPAPPVVLLGGVALGEQCAWPLAAAPKADAGLATIVRRGQRAELRFQGNSRLCAVPEGRLPLALRAGTATSVVTRLTIARGAR